MGYNRLDINFNGSCYTERYNRVLYIRKESQEAKFQVIESKLLGFKMWLVVFFLHESVET